MRILVSFLFGLTAIACSGQGLRASAPIQPVPADGFYRALITPSLSPFLQSDASNVRIYDSRHQEVPYLYSEAVPLKFSTTLREYEVLEKKQVPSCCTNWVLSNPRREAINNISLLVRNADVTKKASLLGSDDKINWYAVKQRFVIPSVNSTTETSEVKVVDFPLSNYLYYSLQIIDSVTAPLNILKAGYYDVSEEQGEYMDIPIKSILKTDSSGLKRSFINIKFDATYWIDRIDFSLQGQPYFLRAGTLFEKSTRTNRKGVKESYFSVRETFQLSSTHVTQLDIRLHNDELLVVIENQDNPVLEIKDVKALQLNRYVTAWLKKGEAYTLEFGDETFARPVYDLAHFKGNIPEASPLVTLEPVRVLSAPAEESYTFFSTRNYIWGAIGGVIVLLGIMSASLIRSMGQKQKTEK